MHELLFFGHAFEAWHMHSLEAWHMQAEGHTLEACVHLPVYSESFAEIESKWNIVGPTCRCV